MNSKSYEKPQTHLQRWFNNRMSKMSVSLVQGKTPQTKITEFFSFINCQANNSDGEDGMNRSITLKATLEDVFALKHAIELVVQGQAIQASRFSINSSQNTSGNGGKKSLAVGEQVVQETGERFVVLVFKEGDDFEVKHVLDAPRALGLASLLDSVARKGLELDMREGSTNRTSGAGGGQGQGQGSAAYHQPGPTSKKEFNPAELFG